jgi:F-type H+-transporting ATPase subunit alpha
MKKVAGTLKLDQAQYRELEAFAKFGSDLDPATLAIIEKGRRNVEILKQPQFTPYPVEHQIAIIFAGTRNLLRDVPVNKVRDFEKEYLDYLEQNHRKDVLDILKQGIINEEIEKILTDVALKIAERYKES